MQIQEQFSFHYPSPDLLLFKISKKVWKKILKICDLLTGNSKLLIKNLLRQLLCYVDIKIVPSFVDKSVKIEFQYN